MSVFGLALDKSGHAGHSECHDAVFGGVDQSLGNEVGPCRTERGRSSVQPPCHLTRRTSGVTVDRHSSEVRLLAASRSVPSGAIEAIVESALALSSPNPSVEQSDLRTGRCVPGVLSELLDKIQVPVSRFRYEVQCITVPLDSLVVCGGG